jgi:hypothetical protein
MPIGASSNKFTHFDYVDPISLDLFKDVVTKKQQMYDEGRSLVQKQLDTYDSFIDQLTKPEDKAYAEQEVAKLTDAVNQHAGLDFSNKSNLQAVLNIGRPLEKDKILTEGIKSSKTYHKLMEDFKKVDPSLRSAENDALFYENINRWQSNPNAGASLSDQPYKPYQKGVVDKYGQVIKEMKPIVETVQKQTADGRWITTTKISSVDAGRIHSAYMGALTPAEKEQLAITARYKMNQIGKDAVAKDYLMDQQSTYKGIEAKVKENEAKYELAKKNNKETNPDMIQFKASLDNLKMQRDVMAKKAMTPLDQIDEGVLVNHLINDDIMNTAGSLAYKEVEDKIEANPYGLEDYKSANNMREYSNKKQMDLMYAARAEEMGLDTGSDGSKSKGLIGYHKMSAKDETELLEASGGPVQSFTDMESLSGATNQSLNLAINAMGGLRLSSDGKTLEPAITRDPKTKAIRNVATVKDMLEIAKNENGMYGHQDLDKIFEGAGGTPAKEAFLWKLKGIAKALEGAKNTQKVAWTAADNNDNQYKREASIEKFYNEPASAVFSQMNDFYIK